MKKVNLSFLSLLMGLFFLVSCGSDSSKYSRDAEGFAKIQDDFKSKFGADAYYTSIFISYISGNSAGSGLTFSVTETDNPASLKMQEWAYNSYSKWQNTAEVTLEIEGDVDPKYFMFQLGDKVNLKKVGEMIEQSAKKLADEKNVDAELETVIMNAPDNNSVESMNINIFMKPKSGGTSFKFIYDLDGNLLDFNY